MTEYGDNTVTRDAEAYAALLDVTSARDLTSMRLTHMKEYTDEYSLALATHALFDRMRWIWDLDTGMYWRVGGEEIAALARETGIRWG